MTTFIVLYRGDTVNTAKMVAVAHDPDLVSIVADKLLHDQTRLQEVDPVLNALHGGRRQALKVIQEESHV